MSDGRPPLPLAALLDDQRRCWQGGAAPPVEEYLARHPGLADDADAVLDLIFQEIILREQRGEVPQLEEYLRRFPRLADTLRLQFSVDRALWEASAGAATPSPHGSAPDTLPLPGELPGGAAPSFDGYEILGPLGRGGMGVVYKAWHLPLRRVVALKVLRGAADAGPQEVARFRAEAEAVARLQHPNIVQVHEVGGPPSRPYLALEYVEGGSLAGRLDGTPWPAHPAAELVEALARAVHHAHERGIVHRDLKPANVLLQARGSEPGGSGIPKIADFGLAKLLVGGGGSLTGSGQILGTPSYMAPEQAAGRSRQVGPAADVYALGAILYELMTGRPPFKGETPQETLLQVLTEEPVPPSRLRPKTPRDLETICLHCLHKDARRRYGSAAALADDLRRFQAGEPVHARPVGPLGRLGRWARRNRAVAGLLLAVILLLAAGSGTSTALWLRASASGRKAGEERDRAEANFRLSLRAVEEYLTRVGDSEELKAYGLEKLRQSLLETANGFYQRFVAEHGDDPQLEEQLARAYHQLGRISIELGELPRAVELCGRMRDLCAARAARRADDRKAREQLADSLSTLCHIYVRLSRWDEAEAAGIESLRLRERLSRENPESDEAVSDIAEVQSQLAALYRELGRWDDVEARHAEARRLRAGVCERHPGHAEYRANLAVSLNNLGTLHQERGQRDKAVASLNEARALREQLHREHPEVPDYTADLAYTLINLATLPNTAGRFDEALPLCKAARDLLTELTRTHPYVVRYRSNCARCNVNLADLYYKTRELDKAERAASEARTLFADLVRQRPDQPEYAYGLSQALNNQALNLFLLKRPKEADEACVEAVKVLEVLCREHPKVPDYQKALAGILLNQGAFLAEAGRPGEAAAAWRRGAAVAKALSDAHPAIIEYQVTLAKCYHNSGTACETQGQPDEAEALYKQAADVNERIWRQHPELVEVGVNLAEVYIDLAVLDIGRARHQAVIGWCDRGLVPAEEVLRRAEGHPRARATVSDLRWNRAVSRGQLGGYAEAVKDWDRAVDLAAAERKDTVRAHRALCLAHAGDLTRSAAEVGALAGSKNVDGPGCYSLATACALVAAAGGSAESSERLAAQAVEWLARATAAGYFRTPANREQMTKDADLNSLRLRADFKSWLAALGEDSGNPPR
jgi:tetratricopeptide (TPR) repeat protein